MFNHHSLPNLGGLQGRVEGSVITPGQADFDCERTGFQRLDRHRPSAILKVACASDVVAVMAFAATHKLPVAVQATGHGLGSAIEGGLLVSMKDFSAVRVNPGWRTARVKGGATWFDVIAAAERHGLAPLSGSLPSVGSVGYTTGGGLGLMARHYGFAADHVRAMEVVAADGRQRRVGPDSEPELFWALRGGGGGFGVVVGLEIDLVPVRRLFGGSLYFDLAETPDVLQAWAEWTTTVPSEVTSAISMMPYPDVSAVPPALRGRHILQIQISCLQAQEEAKSLTRPLQALKPVQDTLREMPYKESRAIFDEPDDPQPYRSKNVLVDTLSTADLNGLTKSAGPAAPTTCIVWARHLGGNLRRQPTVPNAVGHRSAGYGLGVLSLVGPGQEATVEELHRRILRPWAATAQRRSLNFSFGPLTASEATECFESPTWARLVEIKDAYDPACLIHSNLPMSGAASRPGLEPAR